MKHVVVGTLSAFMVLMAVAVASSNTVLASDFALADERETQQRINGYVWLYKQAIDGNDTARHGVVVLEQIYGPELSALARDVAIELYGIEMADNEMTHFSPES